MKFSQRKSGSFRNDAQTQGLFRNQHVRNRNQGFTLIELMVVIIIIGILAALLIPAIGAAIRSSREFTIRQEIKLLDGSFEKFKNKFGVYPIDFKNGNVIRQFVDRLSDRHVYEQILTTQGVYVLANGQNLENPYWDSSDPLSPQWRDPANIDAAEGYVFLLGELTNNPEYPLGYVYDAGSGNWLLDVNGQRSAIYEFKQPQLTDLDNDGWLEYTPASGPKIPFCYFDSRTYSSNDPAIVDLSFYTTGEAGICVPYSNRNDTVNSATPPLYGFEQKDGYQFHSAGLDGVYGEAWNDGEIVSEVRRCTDFTQIVWDGSNWNDETSTARLYNPSGLDLGHNDNFVQFFEGRLDTNKD